ncbi:MAG: PorP/SprF family type IX secretion system membrane protein, partial [Bacteroidia bacterium]
FKLKRGKLSFGLSGGLVNYNINTNKLDYKDAGEQMLTYTGARNAFDANAGFYYYNRSFYLGGSISHLNSPNLYKGNGMYPVSSTLAKNASLFFSLEQHYFLYAGKGFQLNDNLLFNPSIMIKDIQGGTPSADLNANFLLRNRIWLGVSLRGGYGFVALVQVYVTDKFKVGYAYDQGLNKIGIAGQSSHEVMLSYDFNVFKTKTLSPRYL